MEKQVQDLIKRVEALELVCGSIQKPKNRREKRPPSEKQKEHHARFRKAYEKWAPEFKKENPNLKSNEIFKMVQEKIKEEK